MADQPLRILHLLWDPGFHCHRYYNESDESSAQLCMLFIYDPL